VTSPKADREKDKVPKYTKIFRNEKFSKIGIDDVCLKDK